MIEKLNIEEEPENQFREDGSGCAWHPAGVVVVVGMLRWLLLLLLLLLELKLLELLLDERIKLLELLLLDSLVDVEEELLLLLVLLLLLGLPDWARYVTHMGLLQARLPSLCMASTNKYTSVPLVRFWLKLPATFRWPENDVTLTITPL